MNLNILNAPIYLLQSVICVYELKSETFRVQLSRLLYVRKVHLVSMKRFVTSHR